MQVERIIVNFNSAFGLRNRRRILGDPGADSGGEGKSKRAEKYGTKKSKERREEPLGTMSYQTSSKRSPPFWLLIDARKLLCFSAQSEGRMPYFSARLDFPSPQLSAPGSPRMSTAGLETVFLIVFLGNEQLFRQKNYTAFVHLLKSIITQKKSDFYFLSLAALSSIFAWSCS